ncbi:peptidase [Agromyces larvae]|uniref:Peptidase n=1 Tax=Agromyces larvae TaxID=2929802 RepID=A0ABY4C3C3_9MICO|nr:peptidase [Agromyces larvae]UOE44671.1 peptidase [Agromyces larvae]
MIDWNAFLLVLVSALIGAAIVVSAYALGIRLLTMSGRTPIVTPAEFTDAITIVTPAEIKQAEKRAAKAARKSPLTEGQKRLALLGAWGCFAVSGAAVLVGIYLIVGDHLIKLFGGA